MARKKQEGSRKLQVQFNPHLFNLLERIAKENGIPMADFIKDGTKLVFEYIFLNQKGVNGINYTSSNHPEVIRTTLALLKYNNLKIPEDIKNPYD